MLLQEYRNVDRTYSDVAHTLTYNHNFSPRTDVYSMPLGSPVQLSLHRSIR